MSRLGLRYWGLAAVLLVASVSPGLAAQIKMKDGRTISGKLGPPILSVGEKLNALNSDGAGPPPTIWFVDDELRRVFFPQRQIAGAPQEETQKQTPEKYRIVQQVASAGPTVANVGAVLRIEPFDEFGRRIFTLATARGAENIIQGITEISPSWTKVQGIKHVWDMRIATSSIPKDVLGKILKHQTDPKDLEQRKKVVRFYVQCERYSDAATALQQILDDFSDRSDLKEQLTPVLQNIRQLTAQQYLEELKLRRDAGQHHLVQEQLKSFPVEGASAEQLQAVREFLQEYQEADANRTALLSQFDALAEKIPDAELKKQIPAIADELRAELSFGTMDRLAAFRRMLDDDAMPPSDKVALAITGWLLGSNDASTKLSLAFSLYRMRRVVNEYLTAPDSATRGQVFERFRSEEAAGCNLISKLISHMKPPVLTPEPEGDQVGLYELEVPARRNAPAVRYQVQLPPEYDPYRRYPTIVTLHGAGTTPAAQIDWWAGPWNKQGLRLGQASRFGYIVVAPAWASDSQKRYQYSAEEHTAVLDCLRDACRRFSIDTDRVFLSGHSMGGDAAWDMGLAHPDLWAGVIPIVAKSDRYCSLYWPNAERVPYYFVCGELDGNKLAENARELDRYLNKGYNCTVVEYEGRGHELFSDEIQRLFDWMSRFRRNFFPHEFTTRTMRRWDNFFWWVELDQLPDKAMVEPVDWPPGRGVLPVKTEASLTATNGIHVLSGARAVRVWLSPELVDFQRRVTVTINGRRLGGDQLFQPQLDTLLEDVRTRGDRQHPFWAKLETSLGRAQGSR